MDDWVRLSEAVRLAEAWVGSRAVANRLVMGALQSGTLKAHGTEYMDRWVIGYRRVHLRSDEFMSWLVQQRRVQ